MEIYCFIQVLFFKDKETIWAGLIAFAGAILGGAITYYGVRIQIQQREKEIFMNNVTETVTKIDELLHLLIPILQGFSFAELVPTENIAFRHNELIKEFNEVLSENKYIVYKYIDYDLVELIDFHQKFLASRKKFDYENLDNNMERCSEIYQLLLKEKERVIQKYRYYKN